MSLINFTLYNWASELNIHVHVNFVQFTGKIKRIYSEVGEFLCHSQEIKTIIRLVQQEKSEFNSIFLASVQLQVRQPLFMQDFLPMEIWKNSFSQSWVSFKFTRSLHMQGSWLEKCQLSFVSWTCWRKLIFKSFITPFLQKQILVVKST